MIIATAYSYPKMQFQALKPPILSHLPSENQTVNLVRPRVNAQNDYFGVDLEEIWRVVERDLPELKNKLKKLVGDLEKNK